MTIVKIMLHKLLRSAIYHVEFSDLKICSVTIFFSFRRTQITFARTNYFRTHEYHLKFYYRNHLYNVQNRPSPAERTGRGSNNSNRNATCRRHVVNGYVLKLLSYEEADFFMSDFLFTLIC